MNRRHFLANTVAVTAAFGISSQAAASRRYRACVIGDSQQGKYGHDLHLVFRLRDDVDIVALADPDPVGREEYARQCGAQKTYADYREMLEKERPDLVAIGPRWTIHHRDYLLACAEVGAHGMMEKPLTPDLAEADEVLAAMNNKNLKWSLAFNFRASPEVQRARRLFFEEKVIGNILEVRARGKEDKRSGGEDLIVLGIHLFDTMCYFLGKPEWCTSQIYDTGKRSTQENVREATESLGPIIGDSIHATFGFPGGVSGYFASDKNSDGNGGRWGMNLYGTKGMATLRMDTTPRVAWILDPSWAPANKSLEWNLLPNLSGEMHREPAQVAHYAPIVDDLITAIKEDRTPKVALQDGLWATEMIQAIFESHIADSRVSMPLQNRTHPLKRWQRL